jgi:pyruvate/2-oxoacid:ferredoxin oxidoreductase beta subunit
MMKKLLSKKSLVVVTVGLTTGFYVTSRSGATSPAVGTVYADEAKPASGAKAASRQLGDQRIVVVGGGSAGK